MTNASTPSSPGGADFRVGRVLSRTWSILSRNFFPFFCVTAIAYIPTLLLLRGSAAEPTEPGQNLGPLLLGIFVAAVLAMLSQAVVLYAAFQDMRGRPVRLLESLQVGLQRFLPIIGLAIVAAILGTIGFMLLIVPGVILFTMWFVATPACVVERLGPLRSLGRSSELTKGHRWKIFGLMLVVFIVSFVGALLIEMILSAIGGGMLTFIGGLIWNGIWGAFYVTSAVVSYHDLRVTKEGTNIDQIAAVFE